MISLFPGRACDVSFRETAAEGIAVLTDKNSAEAVEGSKILLSAGQKRYYLTVAIVPSQSEVSRDNILLRGPMGSGSGRYQLISEAQYKVHKAFGLPKARVSFAATILSVLSAAGASINSAQHPGCSGLRCVSLFSWLLISISGASALFAWAKENIF